MGESARLLVAERIGKGAAARLPGCCSCSAVGRGAKGWVIVPLLCRRWACPLCRKIMGAQWAERVGRQNPERFITITGVPSEKARATAQWRILVKSIRRKGIKFEFWGLIEPHKSGALHFHFVSHGDYLPHKFFQERAHGAGFGWVWIGKVGCSKAAGRYVVKHLAAGHGRWVPGRVIRYSRGFFRFPDPWEGSRDEDCPGFSRVPGWWGDWYASFRLAGLEVRAISPIPDFRVGDIVAGGVVVKRGDSAGESWRFRAGADKAEKVLQWIDGGLTEIDWREVISK